MINPWLSTNKCRFLPQIFFSPVVASLIATNRTGFDRLAVDNGSAGFWLPANRDAELTTQGMMHTLPCSIPLPLAEIEMDGGPIWKIMRNHSPWTATT